MLNNNVLFLLGVFASALGGCSKYESQKPPTISTLEWYQTPGFLYICILSVSIVEWNTLPLSDRASKKQYCIWAMSILIVLLWCILPNAIAWMKLSQTNCCTNSPVHLCPLSLVPWSSCPLCLVSNLQLCTKSAPERSSCFTSQVNCKHQLGGVLQTKIPNKLATRQSLCQTQI